MALYTPDYRLTGPAAQLHEQQFRDNAWRQELTQAGQGLLARRRAETAQLPDQFVAAGSPASAFQMQDDLQRQAFAARRSGVAGGSADLGRQTRARAAHGGRLAQLQSAGMDAQRQQEMADEQEYMRWLAQAYGAGAGDSFSQQARMDASGARAGEISRMGGLDMQADQQRVEQQGLQSQIIGGQLSNAAGAFQTAGKLGVGPQWVQRWGNSMTAGR